MELSGLQDVLSHLKKHGEDIKKNLELFQTRITELKTIALSTNDEKLLKDVEQYIELYANLCARINNDCDSVIMNMNKYINGVKENVDNCANNIRLISNDFSNMVDSM